ncbi:MFS transporter [Curtanaerobium respiraculi]|uniref:MFS transporter n=1 Tax=Curtanaerobium respiraculi TaxID=2949669 RepID=UPI0024B34000|nr:MFS transporter [Curtanaerobium respiraculi]
MLVPSFAIDEHAYAVTQPSQTGTLGSLAKTFKNKQFRTLVESDILYWIALTMFQTGLPFYITELMGLDDGMTFPLFALMTLISFACYAPVNLLAKRLGKKKMVVFAFLFFAGAFLITAFVGTLGIPGVAWGVVVAVLAAIPMAILGILPQAVVADIAEADALATGEARQGMFYAARTFAFKLGQSVSMLMFTSIALIGIEGFGYRLTAFTAAAFCLAGGLVFLRYRESDVFAAIESAKRGDGEKLELSFSRRRMPCGRKQGAYMEPVWYSVSFATSDGVRVMQVEGMGRYDVQDAAFELGFEGDVCELSVIAAGPLRVVECEVGFAHPFGKDDELLLNGYQSWTATDWMGVGASLRGLDRVPDALVNRYALDASGDYRFAAYSGKPGRLHGYSYAAFRSSGGFTLVGGLQERNGFTLIRTDCAANTVVASPECPERLLRAGEHVVLCRIAVVEGAEEDAAYDRWFALAGIEARGVEPLCGYTSWYRRYERIDEAGVLSDLRGASEAFDRLDTQGMTRVFQIDDGWCKKGDWPAVDAGKFPHGLRPIADEVRKAGFLPGLWMAPFVVEKDSILISEHPEWLLRDEDGSAVITGSHWSGHCALDTRNDEVQAYVASCVRKAVSDWGFGLLKLDFLYAACMVPHDGMNRGQLMADAWDLLRAAAGEETLLLACGVPLASVFGGADYCRIGCDVGLDWDDKLPMRLLHRERASTKTSLADTKARAPLDGRAFGCDPDVVFLRSDVKLKRGQRDRLLAAAAGCGSVLMTSDDMGSWNSSQRAAFEAALHQMRTRDDRG